MTNTIIPTPVLAVVASILSERNTHAELNNLFMMSDAPGDAPDGNKLFKCQAWLARCNKDENVDALNVLGKLLVDFMERTFPDTPTWGGTPSWEEEWLKQRAFMHKALAEQGLAYFPGGYVRKAGTTGPTFTLEQILAKRDLAAVDKEFNRALETVESDPPASLTAACSLIEALCKVYIGDKGLDMPSSQTIKPLWQTVSHSLGLDPAQLEDTDLKKILSGLSSIVDGLGAIRTHAGSAHGRGRQSYKIQPRHARLAVHAAHTLAAFVIETWDERLTSGQAE